MGKRKIWKAILDYLIYLTCYNFRSIKIIQQPKEYEKINLTLYGESESFSIYEGIYRIPKLEEWTKFEDLEDLKSDENE